VRISRRTYPQIAAGLLRRRPSAECTASMDDDIVLARTLAAQGLNATIGRG
jgi:hypothetical protein